MKEPSSLRNFFLSWIEAITIVIVMIFVLRMAVITPYRMESNTMTPTLLAGDVFFGFKLPFGLKVPGFKKSLFNGRAPHRGEVVTLLWPKEEQKSVARVLGIPGDDIEIRDGAVILNGKPLKIEGNFEAAGGKSKLWAEYVNGTTYGAVLSENAPEPLVYSKILVPPAKYFVVTDARGAIEGLTQMGLIDQSRIESKAFMVAVSVGRRSESESFMRWERFFQAIH